jgi:hypothetical protein
MKNMEAEEYEKIFSYLSDGSYIKGKDLLFTNISIISKAWLRLAQ